MKKLNLHLSFQDEEEKKSSEKNLVESCVIGVDGVEFKKDDFAVGKKGVTKITTGQVLSIIDPSELEVKEEIGKGASGFVQKAIHKSSGTELALKSINIYDKEKRSQLRNDLKMLQSNKNLSDNLIKFYGAFFYEGTVKLALEYMDLSSLDKIINRIKSDKTKLSEKVISKITFEILKGLKVLHKDNHQIHRDLKPGNILINSEGFIKLTDFGISRTLENSIAQCKTFVGTKIYMSPERIVGNEYSYASDIWSLGLIVIELATGKFPYSFSNVYIEHVESILSDPSPSLPENEGFSTEMIDFVNYCLQKDPNNRENVVNLLNHPWIKNNNFDDNDLRNWIGDFFGVKMEID